MNSIIIIASILTALSLLSMAMRALTRVPIYNKRDVINDIEDNDNADDNVKLPDFPAISVIILTSDDDIEALRLHLPQVLSQKCASPVQFIVVANEGDTLTDDVVKQYAVSHPNLQSTFIPRTSRYISRYKLGVTLGVKAAKYEWCMLMNANSCPDSAQWLRTMAMHCTEQMGIVMGYCNYDSSGSRAYQRYERLLHFGLLLREANGGHKVFCGNGSNLMFRKSLFIDGDGYRGNLECIRGEYDFIVNKYAQPGEATLVTSPCARLTDNAPYDKQWHTTRMYAIHTQRLLEGRHTHGLAMKTDTLFLHLTLLCLITAVIISTLLSQWIILAVSALLLIITPIVRALLMRKPVSSYDLHIPFLILPWLDFCHLWHGIADKLRYHHSSQYDYTCHKI